MSRCATNNKKKTGFSVCRDASQTSYGTFIDMLTCTVWKRFSVFVLCFLFHFVSVPLTCRFPPSLTSPVPDPSLVRLYLICCWVSVQALHPSEEHLKANYVTTPREGCPNQKAPSFPVCGGWCTATILCGLTYPTILCVPKKDKRKRENGDIAWRRSSLSQAWAAEIVT